MNSLDTICDESEDGFYFDKNNQCKKCHYPVKISNGYCRVCSDNLENYQSGNCWCDKYYTKNATRSKHNNYSDFEEFYQLNKNSQIKYFDLKKLNIDLNYELKHQYL